MPALRRRSAALAALAFLSGCGSSNPFPNAQMTLDQVKAYAASYVGMIDAAAQVYLASQGAKDAAQVQQWLTALDQAEQSLQSVTAPTDVKSLLLQVIQFAQSLEPIVATFLGPNASYVELGLAVLRALVAAYQPPQNAPTPAQMDNTVRSLRVEHPAAFRRSR